MLCFVLLLFITKTYASRLLGSISASFFVFFFLFFFQGNNKSWGSELILQQLVGCVTELSLDITE